MNYVKQLEVILSFISLSLPLRRKVEGNLLVGELSVNSSVSIGTSLNIGLVTSIKVDLEDTTSVNLAAGALSGDLGGVDNVLENGVLDGSELFDDEER